MENPPPCIKTKTGKLFNSLFELVCGVKTFKLRQFSFLIKKKLGNISVINSL